jgi:putative transposase
MRTGRPKKPIILTKEAEEQLKSLSNSRSLPHSIVNRARIILMAADNVPNSVIAEKVDLSHQMVSKWRQEIY